MEFRILGPLEVFHDDRAVPIAGEMRGALLALLLLNANRVVATDRLIDELWEEDPPETGAKALQMHVSQLRKALEAESAASVLITRAPGYLIQVESGALDLDRFERLTAEGDRALAMGAPADAAERLSDALALWRGPALAEFSFAAFGRVAAARLEELRLAALEKRIEADLALGRHADLVAELEDLVSENPFRERLQGQLMLALYRAGRQAESLAAYRDARRALVDELGIEPGHALQELERAILGQDPALRLQSSEVEWSGTSPPRVEPNAAERSILVVPSGVGRLDALISIAEPLTKRPRREIIVALLVEDDRALAESSASLERSRGSLAARGVSARAAAFTTEGWGNDVVRLATEQDVDLLVVDAPSTLLSEGLLPGALETVLTQSPCDVAVFVSRDDSGTAGIDNRPIVVPFGGHEHEWSAVEIGAWIAAATGTTLQLLGSAADPGSGKRDASRLLAVVSLIVQRAAGIATKPLLAPPGEEGVMRAVEDAGLIVVGLSDRWAQEGLGPVRLSLARNARAPMLLVRRGLRPGGLAPVEGMTRYTWSLAHQHE
jgi:DNA-binding SARP family transcriptional activator/nucleotide-binding universal stress UspA family protein